ncbi:MAG: hypothetical protein QXX87_00955 [Candidatus Jordarchaeales archaeon]
MPKVVHPQKVKVVEGKVEAEDLLGKRIFHLTEYVLAGEGGEWRSFRVRSEGDGFLRKVVEVQQTSSESETLFVSIDVDPSSKREVLSATSKFVAGRVRCVAYKARYQHIGLAFFEPPGIHVHLVEVEPPPPKLVDYANKAVAEGLVRRDTKFSATVVNILDLVRGERNLITPCKIDESDSILTLDRDAERIASIEGNYTLLGCPVTLATLREVNPSLKVRLVDMCPAHLARKARVKADCYVVRCCKASVQGTILHGTRKMIVYLQWSPTLEEFLEAIYEATQKSKKNTCFLSPL